MHSCAFAHHRQRFPECSQLEVEGLQLHLLRLPERNQLVLVLLADNASDNRMAVVIPRKLQLSQSRRLGIGTFQTYFKVRTDASNRVVS